MIFEKCLKIGGLSFVNELFKKLKTYKALTLRHCLGYFFSFVGLKRVLECDVCF